MFINKADRLDLKEDTQNKRILFIVDLCRPNNTHQLHEIPTAKKKQKVKAHKTHQTSVNHHSQ